MDLRRVTLVQVARKMRMFRVVQKKRLQVFRDQEIRIDKAAKEWQADPTTDTRGEKSMNFESVKRFGSDAEVAQYLNARLAR